MKQQITNFDFEDAFKALDELDIPKTTGRIKAKALTENFSRTDKFQALFEDYYNISDNDELAEAKEDRDSEIAKAKLARIERIVDLNAESEEDILPTYAGKVIVQCPQCMTLFYKDSEDIAPSAEDETIVNVDEKCQHCGNTDGYTLIGKVAKLEPDEAGAENAKPAEVGTENSEATSEATEELPAAEEATSEEDQTAAAEDVPPESTEETLEVAEEEDEEEKPVEVAEESFNNNFSGNVLNEEVDKDLNQKLAEHNQYIEYIQKQIDEAEKALKTAENTFIKNSIQKQIENLTADLDAAIPPEVKDEVPTVKEVPAEIEVAEVAEAEEPEKEDTSEKAKTESLHESKQLVEDQLPELNAANIDKLFDALEAAPPVSEAEVQNAFKDTDDINNLNDVEELDEPTFNKVMTEYLADNFKNVDAFEATDCELEGGKLIIEGRVSFKSGKSRKANFEFNKVNNKPIFECVSKNIKNKEFKLGYGINEATKSLKALKIIND